MRTIKALLKNLLISGLVYGMVAILLFIVFATPLSPYWEKKKIDTTGIERAEMIMWDYPNIIFSASNYIKQSFEALWEDAGLQLYYVAMYVPEDVSTEEQMIDIFWKEINESIYMDNAVYVCTSYYDTEAGDDRNDFFIYNHLLFGKNAEDYCNEFFMRTYSYYYDIYESAMKAGTFYTYSDLAALSLMKAVDIWNGINIANVVNASVCLLLFVLLMIIHFMTLVKEKKMKKWDAECGVQALECLKESWGNTALYTVETEDKREYQ